MTQDKAAATQRVTASRLYASWCRQDPLVVGWRERVRASADTFLEIERGATGTLEQLGDDEPGHLEVVDQREQSLAVQSALDSGTS
jgi:hypothetical protein